MVGDFKTRLTLHLVIAFGVAAIIGGALIYLGRNIENTADGIISARTELNIRQQQISDLARLREEAKLAQPSLETLRNALPTRDELISLPDQLEELSSEHGVSLNFSFVGSGNEKVGFQMTLEGDYSNIVDFLKAQEEKFFYVIPTDVDMIQRQDDYTATLSGEISFSDEEQN